MDDLIFSKSPDVHFASNIFRNVPVILQYKDTPLIEVVREQIAGFTSQFRIYGPDGAYWAKVKGSRMFRTDDGKKAGVQIVSGDKVTACIYGKQTLFELRRLEAAALKTEAELFTYDGRFLRCRNDGNVGVVKS